MYTTYGVGQYSEGHASEAHTAGWRRDYKTGGRGLIWCHSKGANSREPWDPTEDSWVPGMAGITSLGSVIMSGDLGGDAWGNSSCQSFMSDVWAWLKTQYGTKTDKAIIGAMSMGALGALNWARANPTLVKAIILFYPCVNLQAQHDGTGGAAPFAASIETAYGGVPVYSTFDPSHNAASYMGIPIRMYYSSADTTVGTSNQTAFATAVGGSAFSSVSLGAVAHADMTQPSVNDACSWLEAYQ